MLHRFLQLSPHQTNTGSYGEHFTPFVASLPYNHFVLSQSDLFCVLIVGVGHLITLNDTHTHTHTQTHTHTRQDSSGRVIGPSQTPLPDNTLFTRDRPTCPSRIRTRNSSMPAAAYQRLNPRDHRDLLHHTSSYHHLTICILTSQLTLL